MNFLDLPDLRLAYRRMGSGPTLLDALKPEGAAA